jgi:DNA-binding Xre family transcriptional regulator
MSIHLRAAAYADLAKAHGHHTYEQQAVAAGLGIATIHRLRKGGPASSTAVAALCSLYGCEFADLFEIRTPKPEQTSVAA